MVVGYGGFDALGDVTSTNVQVAGQKYSFAYSYNVSGGLISEPSGRVVTTATMERTGRRRWRAVRTGCRRAT